MPSPRRNLTLDQARELIASRGFVRDDDASAPDRQVGVEIEWLAVDLDDAQRPASLDVLRRAADTVGTLPGGGHVTFEPGGQFELSSAPWLVDLVCPNMATDVQIVGTELERAGVGLIALGLEPGPQRVRTVCTPRYDAMEAFFDAEGGPGRTMMCSTAATQVNLGFGALDMVEQCWSLTHDLGPVLAAAFANSPFDARGPSGHRSTRLAVWRAIDQGRTAPAHPSSNGEGCREAWADYALAANVMLVRDGDDAAEPLLSPFPFAEWIDRGHALGWPGIDDLEYHLTTLFPPVRPRGWLELRMIDGLPSPWWRVATAVASVLVHETDLADAATAALAPARALWTEAARDALQHPVLARAAQRCFALAHEAMPAAGVDAVTIEATAAYIDRYVSRGLTPADWLLDRWARTGVMLPPPENVTPEAVWT